VSLVLADVSLRSELLNTPGVLFAGYKVPHPLEPVAVIKLQTDGNQTPTQALEAACTQLISMISKLQDNFKMEFSTREADLGETEDAYGAVGNMGGSSSAAWGAGRDYMDF
jgi:DNA-directed RNA polymerase II subunit RPB11